MLKFLTVPWAYPWYSLSAEPRCWAGPRPRPWLRRTQASPPLCSGYPELSPGVGSTGDIEYW